MSSVGLWSRRSVFQFAPEAAVVYFSSPLRPPEAAVLYCSAPLKPPGAAIRYFSPPLKPPEAAVLYFNPPLSLPGDTVLHFMRGGGQGRNNSSRCCPGLTRGTLYPSCPDVRHSISVQPRRVSLYICPVQTCGAISILRMTLECPSDSHNTTSQDLGPPIRDRIA